MAFLEKNAKFSSRSATLVLGRVVWERGRNKTIRLGRADTIFGNSAEIRPEISSAVLDGSSEKLNKILKGRAAGSEDSPCRCPCWKYFRPETTAVCSGRIGFRKNPAHLLHSAVFGPERCRRNGQSEVRKTEKLSATLNKFDI